MGASPYPAGSTTPMTSMKTIRIGAGGDTRLQTLATDGRIESTTGSVLSAGMDPSGVVRFVAA